MKRDDPIFVKSSHIDFKLNNPIVDNETIGQPAGYIYRYCPRYTLEKCKSISSNLILYSSVFFPFS